MSEKASTIITFLYSIILTGTVTSAVSEPIKIEAWSRFMLYIDVLSAGAPSTVQILTEFSPDNGVTWYSYMKDFWSDLLYEATGTAVQLHESIDGISGGDNMRIKIIGVGTTDVGDTFTVSVKGQFFNT